ncbi:MAG: alpha/beta hydrolase [Nocardiopsaceae bacterium]|nr:alpha/beta hydrolase [Nocardiopsaceae bacterium]
MSTPRSLRIPSQVKQHVIETSRGNFAALSAQAPGGASDRKPALLVPGYTGSKEDFLSILEPLATAGRAVAAIDMRGQYQSAPATNHDGYALDELAGDLLTLAGTLAGESRSVHLLGHSFGGLVARQATIASPGAFASVTLLCSGPGTIGGERAKTLRELLDFLEPAGTDVTLLGSKIDEVWNSQLKPQALADGTPPEIIDFLAERAAFSCPLGLAEMARHLLNCPDRTAELAALEQLPKLVSYGENDDAWPPDVQDMMAKRLGAERICIPAAAHSPAVEAPETTAAMLTAFWNQAESVQPPHP